VRRKSGGSFEALDPVVERDQVRPHGGEPEGQLVNSALHTGDLGFQSADPILQAANLGAQLGDICAKPDDLRVRLLEFAPKLLFHPGDPLVGQSDPFGHEANLASLALESDIEVAANLVPLVLQSGIDVPLLLLQGGVDVRLLLPQSGLDVCLLVFQSSFDARLLVLQSGVDVLLLIPQGGIDMPLLVLQSGVDVLLLIPQGGIDMPLLVLQSGIDVPLLVRQGGIDVATNFVRELGEELAQGIGIHLQSV
jgi:hypothetical protein